MSSLEIKVGDLLWKAGIRYVREKSFDELKKGKYRYDFYLPDLNILLEVHGQQHYEFNTYFYKNRGEATRAHERDRRKCNFALAKGIKLYCIPYWEIDNLQTADDLFQEKFLVKSQFHNDIAYSEYKRTR